MVTVSHINFDLHLGYFMHSLDIFNGKSFFFFLNRNGQCVECTCICCLSMIFSIYAKQVMRKATNGSRNNGTFLICIVYLKDQVSFFHFEWKPKTSFEKLTVSIATILLSAQYTQWREHRHINEMKLELSAFLSLIFVCLPI